MAVVRCGRLQDPTPPGAIRLTVVSPLYRRRRRRPRRHARRPRSLSWGRRRPPAAPFHRIRSAFWRLVFLSAGCLSMPSLKFNYPAKTQDETHARMPPGNHSSSTFPVRPSAPPPPEECCTLHSCRYTWVATVKFIRRIVSRNTPLRQIRKKQNSNSQAAPWQQCFINSGYQLWLAKTAKTFHGCFSVLFWLT